MAASSVAVEDEDEDVGVVAGAADVEAGHG